MTPSTATGRRCQLFSPVPEMNGSGEEQHDADHRRRSGSATVSMYGGSSAKTENSDRK